MTSGKKVSDIRFQLFKNFIPGKSMVGQTIVLDIVAGDMIRLFNYGGDIYDDPTSSDSYFHFIGVLLYSSDRG